MAAHKRTSAQRDADREFIADLTLQGATLTVIRGLLKDERGYELSLTQIANDLKAVREAWAQNSIRVMGDHIEASLRLYEKIKFEAFQGYQRSLRDRLTLEKENGVGSSTGKKPGKWAKTTREKRDGGAEWLMVILKADERKCRVLGLDRNVNEHSGPGGGPIPIPHPQKMVIEIVALPDETPEPPNVASGA